MPPGDAPLVDVCINWDTEKLIYSTRASVNDSWLVSNNPPLEPIPITEIIDTFITTGTFYRPSYYSHTGSLSRQITMRITRMLDGVAAIGDTIENPG
jgi:hypothetical protein